MSHEIPCLCSGPQGPVKCILFILWRSVAVTLATVPTEAFGGLGQILKILAI